MQVRTVLRGLVITTVLAVLAALLPQMASAGLKGASGRYLVVARSSADYGALRAKAIKEGRGSCVTSRRPRPWWSTPRPAPAAAWPPTGAPRASPATGCFS